MPMPMSYQQTDPGREANAAKDAREGLADAGRLERPYEGGDEGGHDVISTWGTLRERGREGEREMNMA